MKVAIFGFTGSLAHAGRMSAVSRALTLQGHTVRLHGNPKVLGRFDPGTAGVSPHAEPSWQTVRAMDPDADLAWFLKGILDDREAIRADRPDLVVTDNRRSTGPAAEAEGVPWAALSGAALLGPHCGFAPTIAELIEVASAFGSTPFDLLDRAVAAGATPDTLAPLRAAPLAPGMIRALTAIGARPREWVHELDLGTVTFALDLPAILPVVDAPATVQCLPPVLPEALGPSPELPAGYTLVAMGSTSAAGLREAIATQLVAAGRTVVMAGDGPDVAGAVNLGMSAPSVFRRAAVVVCHGGATTLYRCIASDVPFVALPGHPEQAIHALAFARAGLGIAHSPADVSQDPGLLLDALDRAATCTRMPCPTDGAERLAAALELIH